MGKEFKYIADAALPLLEITESSSCHSCGSSTNPIYYYNGKIIDPQKTYNPKLAIEEPEVSELCGDCIRSGNIECSDYYLEELRYNVEEEEEEDFPENSIDEILASPQINSAQGPYWATCCNDFTEYIGEHPIDGTSYEDYHCKLPNFIIEKFELKNFYPLEKLPVMYTMNLFQCHHCSNKYWNFQYSGLMWEGPIESLKE